MAQQVYPAGKIVRNIIDAFLPHRGLTLAGKGLAPDVAARAYTEDEVISDMEQFAHVRIDAVRTTPRGQRDWVVILILSSQGKPAHHSPDLRMLLDSVKVERAAKAGRLDELIIVAEKPFFGKKNLLDVINAIKETAPHDADPEGTAAFCGAYPYQVFSDVLPENESVRPHEIMTPAEVATMLAAECIKLADMPTIPQSDPPIVWNGGREGQVVRILRDSQTAGEAVYYRRVV